VNDGEQKGDRRNEVERLDLNPMAEDVENARQILVGVGVERQREGLTGRCVWRSRKQSRCAQHANEKDEEEDASHFAAHPHHPAPSSASISDPLAILCETSATQIALSAGNITRHRRSIASLIALRP
jgi:hypothetical protein